MSNSKVKRMFERVKNVICLNFCFFFFKYNTLIKNNVCHQLIVYNIKMYNKCINFIIILLIIYLFIKRQ